MNYRVLEVLEGNRVVVDAKDLYRVQTDSGKTIAELVTHSEGEAMVATSGRCYEDGTPRLNLAGYS